MSDDPHLREEVRRFVKGLRLPSSAARPITICLCGSTRFKDVFDEANYVLTLNGCIVLTVAFAPGVTEHGEHIGITPAQKEALDVLHLQKIDRADVVVVLNVGGYVGESTRREIAYARQRDSRFIS